jgi:hypothetical protein
MLQKSQKSKKQKQKRCEAKPNLGLSKETPVVLPAVSTLAKSPFAGKNIADYIFGASPLKKGMLREVASP